MTLTMTDGRVYSAQEIERLAAAIAGTYVVPTASGGAVTASAGMVVAVAAIVTTTGLYVNGVQDTTGYAGGTTTIAAADATNPRRDLVWYDGAGGIGSTAGTAAASPALPTLTAGRIALAEIYVAANDTAISGASEIIDKRMVASVVSATTISGLTKKYKSATQTVSASTTFVDMTASSGSLAAAIAATEVWLYEWIVPLTFTGTGGAKFQVTGPAVPTAVLVNAYLPQYAPTDGVLAVKWVGAVTGFSTPFGAFDASAGVTTNTYQSNVNGGTARITALIANGANAGTVTLQYAQNSANGTVVAGIGALLRAERIA